MRQLIVFAVSRVPGVVVTEAQDGFEGMKRLATRRFDLIVTDINMPIMDGLKLIHRVRGDATHKDTPILVVTTESAAEDRERAMALGATAYLTKPAQAPVLIAKVKELLGLSERATPP